MTLGENDEEARLATTHDVVVIQQIRKRYLGSIEGERGAELLVAFELPDVLDKPELEQLVLGQDTLVVVGTYAGVVFGYGLATIVDLGDGRPLGRLTEFVVDSEIRKSGVGEAMMNFLVGLMKDHNCIGMDSIALPGDRNTKNFFESFGLKARLLTVHKSF